ncbi:MAG: putative toxin-antitoxin system toxin component, PIN family [Candidatus Micrarchaeota archaeon]
MRILIDTNILLSGLFFSGNESRLLDLALSEKIELLLLEDVLIETKNVIERKKDFFQRSEIPLSLLDLIQNRSVFVRRPAYSHLFLKAKSLIRDDKDVAVLAGVLAVPHDYFVSGDKDFAAPNLPTHVSVKELLSKIKTG